MPRQSAAESFLVRGHLCAAYLSKWQQASGIQGLQHNHLLTNGLHSHASLSLTAQHSSTQHCYTAPCCTATPSVAAWGREVRPFARIIRSQSNRSHKLNNHLISLYYSLFILVFWWILWVFSYTFTVLVFCKQLTLILTSVYFGFYELIIQYL